MVWADSSKGTFDLSSSYRIAREIWRPSCMLSGIAHKLSKCGTSWVSCLLIKHFGEITCRSGLHLTAQRIVVQLLQTPPWKIVFPFAVWNIWKSRNRFVFSSKNRNLKLAAEIVNFFIVQLPQGCKSVKWLREFAGRGHCKVGINSTRMELSMVILGWLVVEALLEMRGAGGLMVLANGLGLLTILRQNCGGLGRGCCYAATSIYPTL